jgi:hypothetical protein
VRGDGARDRRSWLHTRCPQRPSGVMAAFLALLSAVIFALAADHVTRAEPAIA